MSIIVNSRVYFVGMEECAERIGTHNKNKEIDNGYKCQLVYKSHFICASIIMLQKVAAMVNKVAADLRFRACKVRWLLMKIFFAIAASSAAIFCAPLYNIVMPYFRHFGSFVPKICKCCYKNTLKASGRC